MEVITVPNDIEVLCLTAKSFPDGVHDAHEELRVLLPPAAERRYFGVSHPQNGTILYKAAAELIKPVETQLPCEPFTIRRGQYASITLFDYYKDLPNVTTTFQKLLAHPRLDPNGYCLEWYVTDKDVRCMVPLRD